MPYAKQLILRHNRSASSPLGVEGGKQDFLGTPY